MQTIKVDNNPTMASCVAFTARGQSYGQKAKMDVSVLLICCIRDHRSIGLAGSNVALAMATQDSMECTWSAVAWCLYAPQRTAH